MLIKKRKLTKNQSRRIEQNRKESATIDAQLYTGQVVAHFGKQLLVEAAEFDSLCRCHARTTLPMLATGDVVQFSFDTQTKLGRIETLSPRKTLVCRPDRYHKIKPVAANADVLVVVVAPLPKPAPSLIDRYLLIAHVSGLPCILVVNKDDLMDEPTLALIEDYRSLGITVITTCLHRPDSLSPLKQRLSNKTALFAGQSGVGKSSLINLLIPHANQSTNTISTLSKLGQHTTTTSRLLRGEDGHFCIIDTPGIREYGVWHLHEDEIFGGFFELLPYQGSCRFRDCSHTSDAKGCALWQAVAENKVKAERVLSFVALKKEAKEGHGVH